MKAGKKCVAIKLATTIDDAGEIEYNHVQEVGDFYHREEVDVLIYDEEIEAGAIVRNLVTIHPTKVTIKRSGLIEMSQTFEVGKMTESHYQHPHGAIHMETHTHSLTHESLAQTDTGHLLIAYTVKLNGLHERKHVLELTYHKEDEA